MNIKNKFLRHSFYLPLGQEKIIIKYFGSTVNDFRGQKFKTKIFAAPI